MTNKNNDALKPLIPDGIKYLILWTNPWQETLAINKKSWYTLYYLSSHNKFWDMVATIYPETLRHINLMKTSIKEENYRVAYEEQLKVLDISKIGLWDCTSKAITINWKSDDGNLVQLWFNDLKTIFKTPEELEKVKVVMNLQNRDKGKILYDKKEYKNVHYLTSTSNTNSSMTFKEKKDVWKNFFSL